MLRLGNQRYSIRYMFIFVLVLAGVIISILLPFGLVQAATEDSGYDYGDANRSGAITTTDRAYLNQMLLGQRPVDPAADANMDGRLTTTDRSWLNQVISGVRAPVAMLLAAYDFSQGSGDTRWAKSNSLSDLPPTLSDTFDSDPTGWVEATAGQYINISEEHTTVWTIAAASSAALQCKFTVDERANAGDITSIRVYFNGSSEASGDVLKFWVWNFGSEEWKEIGSGVTLSTDNESHNSGWTKWGKVYGQYIDSNDYMYVLLVNTASGNSLNVNYVNLELSTPTGSVTPVKTPTPTATVIVEPTATPNPTATQTVAPTPTLTPSDCENVYNYVGISAGSGPHSAFYINIWNMPPPRWLYYLCKVELTDTDYQDIAASDDARWETSRPGWGAHVLVMMEMRVDEAPETVERIDLLFEGYGEAGSDFEIWAYNYVTSKGERIGNKMWIPSGSDKSMVRSITSNCANYIGEDGKVIWGVYQKATTHKPFTNGYWMAIDYVEMVVSHRCP